MFSHAGVNMRVLCCQLKNLLDGSLLDADTEQSVNTRLARANDRRLRIVEIVQMAVGINQHATWCGYVDPTGAHRRDKFRFCCEPCRRGR